MIPSPQRLALGLLLALALVATASADPFSVATYADLCKVGTGTDGWTLDASYIQTAVIQCPDGANFPRIGESPGTPFTGTYDGQGYAIRNLTMSYSDFHTGMFICTESPAEISNVTLEDVDLKCGDISPVGALVGLSAGTISNCTVSGTVTGGACTGGLIGTMESGEVTNCSSSCTIISGDQSGGLIGYMTGGTVTSCESSGSVAPPGSSSLSLGGLIGRLDAGILSHSRSSCTVTGCDRDGGLIGVMGGGSVLDCHASGAVNTGGVNGYALGGLVGYLSGGTISNSSASGNVTTNSGNHFGGLVGHGDGGSLTRCSATGTVSQTGSGGWYYGGLVGESKLTITECYASGVVNGGYYVGGLVGDVDTGLVSDSYATGAVTATEEPYIVGGLTGSLSSGTIRSCYATGLVSAPGASAEALTQRVGGLVGYLGSPSTGVTETCFWNIESTGQTASRGSETGKTTAELQTLETFAAWNIATPANHNGETWYLVSGEDYPRLAWEGVPGVPLAPVAAFTASPTSGYIPLVVQFTDTSANAPTAWFWMFGDGGTSTLQHPSHTYETAGTYTVALTVSNAAGEDTVRRTGLIVANPPPVSAAFTASPLTGPAPLAVQFTDTSAGSPAAWFWDFGDGATSAATDPRHTYTVAGTYPVALTVSRAGYSDTATKTGYITVGAAPTTPSPTTVAGPPAFPYSEQRGDTMGFLLMCFGALPFVGVFCVVIFLLMNGAQRGSGGI